MTPKVSFWNENFITIKYIIFGSLLKRQKTKASKINLRQSKRYLTGVNIAKMGPFNGNAIKKSGLTAKIWINAFVFWYFCTEPYFSATASAFVTRLADHTVLAQNPWRAIVIILVEVLSGFELWTSVVGSAHSTAKAKIILEGLYARADTKYVRSCYVCISTSKVDF